MHSFGDYIVFVDESGDYGMASIDPHYPVFVLALCIFSKEEYAASATPAVLRFKFKHFGHDHVILHEHEIRKSKGAFKFLLNPERREPFYDDLNALIDTTRFELMVMGDKKCNSAGLQLADLVARPIGRKVMNPAQPNRAYEILERKFRRSPRGSVRGWGLKVSPEKRKAPV